MPAPADKSALTFRPRHRLRHDREFQAVFGARVKKSAGPLTVFTRPNDLRHPRLGLSIGRRVGPAVRRNLLKRHLREAFRFIQHDLACLGPAPQPEAGQPPRPGGEAGTCYDIVVASVAHEPLSLEQYARLLLSLVEQADRVWQKRARRDAESDDG